MSLQLNNTRKGEKAAFIEQPFVLLFCNLHIPEIPLGTYIDK